MPTRNFPAQATHESHLISWNHTNKAEHTIIVRVVTIFGEMSIPTFRTSHGNVPKRWTKHLTTRCISFNPVASRFCADISSSIAGLLLSPPPCDQLERYRLQQYHLLDHHLLVDCPLHLIRE